MIRVLRPGPLTTVQDLGRPGLAHLGVGRSGAADRGAARRANALVGNDASAAVLETTLGGLRLRAEADLVLALTGAASAWTVDGVAVWRDVAVGVPAGAEVRIAAPASGVRGYLAARGGIDVAPWQGSRSRDTLSGLGPEPLRAGDLLPVGPRSSAAFPPAVADPAPVLPDPVGVVTLPAVPGPRLDHLVAPAELWGAVWTIGRQADRVGLRLEGPSPSRARTDELPSEGCLPGAVQLTPDGPVLLLADAPVTGGYPVVAVLTAAALDLAAQLRPGQRLRLDPAGSPRPLR